jgi:hypothetical protein
MQMSIKPKTEDSVPPYLPYKTLTNYLENLRESGIPDQIDRSIMRNLSGTTQNQLTACLKFLYLVDDNNQPTDKLTQLVHSEGADRQDILRNILTEAYPNILGDSTNGFRLQSATSSQFNDKFRDLGVKGDTVRKCQYFFLAAARDANIPISSYVKATPTPHQGAAAAKTNGNGNGSGRGRSTSTTANSRRTPSATVAAQQQNFPKIEGTYSPPTKSMPPAPKSLSLQDMLVNTLQVHASKYPEFDPEWTEEAQNKWFEGWERVADRLMTMLDKIQKTQLGPEEVE